MKIDRVSFCVPVRRRAIPGFKAMKVSQFEGVDYSCVRQFKAPIEKFNGMKDFYNWILECKNKKLSKNLKGRSPETERKRCCIMKNWEEGLKNYSPPIALITISSIVKNLKSSNDSLPPAFHSTVFEETVADIEGAVALEPEFQFDITKIYNTHLKEKFMATSFKGVIRDGWITVLSAKEDCHVEKNAELLNVLSHKMWCTKGLKGRIYLKDFSFRIYMENGNPKLCIRLMDNTVYEIQGPLNDSKIPDEYKKLVIDYIEENGFLIDYDTDMELYGDSGTF